MKQIKNKKLFLFLTVILSVMMMFSLAGCGEDDAATATGSTVADDGGYIDVDSAGSGGSDDLSKYNEETATTTTGGESGTTTGSGDTASGDTDSATGTTGGTSTGSTSGSTGGTSSGSNSDSGGSSTSNDGKDQYATAIDEIPDGAPLPVEPGEATVNTAKTGTCTLLIECSTILNNMADFNQDKMSVLPSDGVILSRRTVTFSEGESVFDLLQRETRSNKIHMESSFTPMYNSAYVEGINNLYEFDCGELSGWMYCVNGWYPNYGCSRYQIAEGDVIEWHYTCDLGADLGEDLSRWE